MERYENIVKIEEIRRLTDNNQYEKALKILNTMDVGKVKPLTDLSVIADVYMQNERYDEAMEILTKIYSKTKTRRILYQLVDLSIKRANVPEAEDYLEKYIKAAPQDSSRFIFRYCIDKLNREPYEVLITSLEQLKEYEYYEIWAYELAKLYHKAGMKDKCVRECSDIILWFGEGIYVEKAKLLKGYYVGEINPVHMLKTKEKRETEKKLGLDKTKDYSGMKSRIDELIEKADQKKEPEEEHQKDTQQQLYEDPELKAFFKKVANKLTSKEEYLPPKEESKQTYYPEKGADYEPADADRKEPGQPDEEQEDIKSEGTESGEAYREKNTYKAIGQEVKPEEIPGKKEQAVRDQENQEPESKNPENIASDDMDGVKPETDYLKPEAAEAGTNKNEVQSELYTQKPYSAGKLDLIFSEAGMDYKKDFGYFIHIDFCRKQIDDCLEFILSDYTKINHLIITGGKKSGKTTMAKKISKALYGLNRINTNRVAKIAAGKLNGISLTAKKNKLVHSSLIIENAGQLDNGAVLQLISLILELGSNLFVILEDNENPIKELLMRNPELKETFDSHISLGDYTENDLLGFGITYIQNFDYEFTQNVKRSFIREIDRIIHSVQKEDRLEAVMKLAKKAKALADERNKEVLADIIQTRNLSSEDFRYMKEEDFL